MTKHDPVPTEAEQEAEEKQTAAEQEWTVLTLRDRCNELIAAGFGANVVQTFDPDQDDWLGITGCTYGGDDGLVRLYTDLD